MSPLLANAAAEKSTAVGPKRIIFFLQHHGFSPANCVPEGIQDGDSLKDATLPTFIDPLEPYKDRLTIVNNLHGYHIQPSHSAHYGALGGHVRSQTPRVMTIDSALSKQLGESPIDQLSVGTSSLQTMKTRPIFNNISARGAGDGVPMICDPTLLYRSVFGNVSKDQGQRLESEVITDTFKFLETQSSKMVDRLPSRDQKLHAPYVKGYQELNDVRQKLAGMSKHLSNFTPKFTEKFSDPKLDTDWHDCMLETSIAIMKAGLTNVLTYSSGCGTIFGSYTGLEGAGKQGGHQLGHAGKFLTDTWLAIRRYNMRMLVKIIKGLESVPEGNGTMMDNTLIVYTSNNADYQHSKGENWPFLLLGDLGGKIATGKYVDCGRRPINAFYNTLLYAAGKEQDYFNMSKAVARKHDRAVGPIEDLLV